MDGSLKSHNVSLTTETGDDRDFPSLTVDSYVLKKVWREYSRWGSSSHLYYYNYYVPVTSWCQSFERSGDHLVLPITFRPVFLSTLPPYNKGDLLREMRSWERRTTRKPFSHSSKYIQFFSHRRRCPCYNSIVMLLYNTIVFIKVKRNKGRLKSVIYIVICI